MTPGVLGDSLGISVKSNLEGSQRVCESERVSEDVYQRMCEREC